MKATVQGYILVLALMIISISVLLITSVYYNSVTHAAIVRRFVKRQQAEQLARSGVEIALARLDQIYKKKENTQEVAEEPAVAKAMVGEQTKKSQETAQMKEDPKKRRLRSLLLLVNKWQTFKLLQDREGIEGTIKIYIACEQGKINLNLLYNFANNSFVRQGSFSAEAFFRWLFGALRPLVNNKDYYEAFAKFLNSRKQPLDDVTSLLAAPSFGALNAQVFMTPNEEERRIYLTDLFTIDTNKMIINPWFITRSLAAVLGFKQQKGELSAEQLKKLFDQSDWSKGWDEVLAPIYGKEYKALPDEIKLLFSFQFEPTEFSVVSYATVGEITQKMYAIVHKDRKTDRYSIKKFYWI